MQWRHISDGVHSHRGNRPYISSGRHVHSDLSWLLSQPLDPLAARFDGAASTTVTIVGAHAYRLQAVACDMPLLLVPLQGRKGLRCGDVQLDCGAGDFLLVHRALQFDVENTPDRDGPYRALALAFPWHVVELARSLLGPHAGAGSEPAHAASISVGALEAIVMPLRAYLEADAQDPLMTDYLALGLLVALARLGHRAFLMAHDPSTAARVRLMLAAAPAQDWKSAHVEQQLQMSSATLRRHLREEGTSFRALLLDVRLHAGLALLQTTRRPVKAVAGACGYRSVPSFSRAFARRFGVDPSAVAGA